uniref:SAM hydrolase/SAM-dependent halogenase family protein n=1 Tax=Flavobacterium sp. TaxID=239 RepID=UPI00404AEB24
MAIITLLTDFGLKDHFVGVLKGKILSSLPTATIIDISHNIDPFNIVEAHYILQASYTHFPKGTIHFVGIDTERNKENRHVAIYLDGHFFVGSDNGIMSMLAQKIEPEQMVEVNIHDRLSSDASDLDVLVMVCAHLAKGGVLNVIGKPISNLKETVVFPARYIEERNLLLATIIYIDNFGNAITNVSRKFFESVQKGRGFEIEIKPKPINKILNKYAEIAPNDKFSLKDYEGKELAIFNQTGFLEIAVYRSNPNSVGSANSLLGLEYHDIINIKFNPK